MARRIGFVDDPGGRKDHEGGVPPIGGLVIFFFMIAGWVAMDAFGSAITPLLFGAGGILALGVYDDARQMNPWVKFFLQIIIAFYIVVMGGAEIHYLGNLFGLGDVGLGFMSVPFSVAAFVLLMNAMNMMDGLDGLAGGVSAIILGWLAYAAYVSGLPAISLQISCILIPLLAFLCWNMRSPFMKRAKVFLGDAGSLLLAVIIGWYAVALTQEPTRAVWPISLAWLLAIPVIDTLTLFFIRRLRGRHPFAPDRNHLHHRFMDRGLSAELTTPIIMFAAWICGVVGLMSSAIGITQPILTMLWVAVLAGYIGFGVRSGADRHF